MNLQAYADQTANLTTIVKCLVLAVVILAIVTGFNIISAKKLVNSKQTILVPMGITHDMVVMRETANDSYLSAVGLKILDYVGNITAASAQMKAEAFLPLFAPEVQDEAREGLMKAVRELSSWSTSSLTTPRQPNPIDVRKGTSAQCTSTRPKCSLLTIRAERAMFGSRTKSRRTRVTYEIPFVISNGQFMIITPTIFEVGK